MIGSSRVRSGWGKRSCVSFRLLVRHDGGAAARHWSELVVRRGARDLGIVGATPEALMLCCEIVPLH